MGLFKKKEKKQEIPKLPELPQLPELPEFQETGNFSEENVPELPSFPADSLGNKFSQNTIKDAVSGGEGIEEDEIEFPEKAKFEERMRRPFVREEKGTFPRFEQKTVEEEPIFVRLDKFEEGSKEFDEVKRKVTHIENMFDDIRKIKEKEEKELELWKQEILNIKEKIEKIDSDIFSKLD